MQPVRLTWPGGEHGFRLRLGELRALQEARNAGPEQIFNRLRTGSWEVDDLIQVIRWGLVGADEKTASDAATFVTPLLDLHPLTDFKLTAISILAAALIGFDPDDQLGKAEGAQAETPPEK